ncbi:hypothetical protein GYA27_03795 [candidate division WWE3 bacterium]|uniref:Kanamycin nucleotidyltransferase C-terminal domain-containing protein n=1 Tax=candidate division WWE3 bacterium TaxID=2053526 RepID=A0A7X9HHE2_UNCKA|nr:hypothetical protein [candidate division WWE3 bacterium]
MSLIPEITHHQRLELAENIFNKLMTEKQSEILAVGLYGSMAKNTDHPFSDVEFDVIPKIDGVNFFVSEIYNGIKYEINYISKNILLDNIRNPGKIDWPETISASLTAKPLYDPTGVFDEFKKEYEQFIKTDFTPFYKNLFVEGIYESMCKFVKAAKYDDESAIRFYAYHYLFDEFICFIFILNKSVITNAATRWKDSLEMPVNFESHKRFINLLMSGDVKDADTVIKSAFDVYSDIETYMKSKGVSTSSEEIHI